jgi:predicted RNA polymerase sigma factor
MRDGPAAGLALIQNLNKEDALTGYQWFYSAQADLCRIWVSPND